MFFCGNYEALDFSEKTVADFFCEEVKALFFQGAYLYSFGELAVKVKGVGTSCL